LAGRKIVPADNGVAVGEQAIHQVAADETRRAGDETISHVSAQSLKARRCSWQWDSLTGSDRSACRTMMVCALRQPCLVDWQVKRAFAANFRALAGIKPLNEVPELVAFGNLFQ